MREVPVRLRQIDPRNEGQRGEIAYGQSSTACDKAEKVCSLSGVIVRVARSPSVSSSSVKVGTARARRPVVADSNNYTPTRVMDDFRPSFTRSTGAVFLVAS